MKTNYHEAINWEVGDIHARLGELALNDDFTPRQKAAAEKEADCLMFELECRVNEDAKEWAS